MSQRDRDYDEILRRALHASADSVEPAEDGLERIRARLTRPYPVPVAWMMAGYSEAARRALGGLQSVLTWLSTVPGAVRERFRAARRGPPHGRRLARLRPAAGLAIAVFAVAAGALALTPLPRQAISHTAALIRALESGGPARGTAGPGVSGRGTGVPTGGTAVTSTAPGTPNHRQPASASCAAPTPALTGPTASPAASTTPTTSPSPAACPSPATSTSPGACPSPAATPSPTGSPSPAGSPNPAATPSPAGSPSPTGSPTPSVTPSASPTGSASQDLGTSPSPSASPARPGETDEQVRQGRQRLSRNVGVRCVLSRRPADSVWLTAGVTRARREVSSAVEKTAPLDILVSGRSGHGAQVSVHCQADGRVGARDTRRSNCVLGLRSQRCRTGGSELLAMFRSDLRAAGYRTNHPFAGATVQRAASRTWPTRLSPCRLVGCSPTCR